MTQLNADVLIHRWFEVGANWAYAPRLQSNLIDLVTAGTISLEEARSRCPASEQLMALGARGVT